MRARLAIKVDVVSHVAGDCVRVAICGPAELSAAIQHSLAAAEKPTLFVGQPSQAGGRIALRIVLQKCRAPAGLRDL